MEILTFLAILLSPVIAVAVTLFYQRRKSKDDAKRSVFFTLMAQRKSIPPTAAEVGALNMIDVIFYDTPKVIQLWHEYYGLLCQQNTQPILEAQQRKQIELLSAIASSLGYRTLQQTDIEQFYLPQAHFDQALLTAGIQNELLRVLKNSSSIVTTPREATTSSTGQ